MLCVCLPSSWKVPNASTGLADNRTMFLKKQFAFVSEDTSKRGISLEDIVRAMGPRGMNIGVSSGCDIRSLCVFVDLCALLFFVVLHGTHQLFATTPFLSPDMKIYLLWSVRDVVYSTGFV